MLGAEISLIMEVVSHFGLVNLFPPANYYTFKHKKKDAIADMMDDEDQDNDNSSLYNFETVLSRRASLKKADKN